MTVRRHLEFVWLGWSWWRSWSIVVPTWESAVRWLVHAGPVMIRRYK